MLCRSFDFSDLVIRVEIVALRVKQADCLVCLELRRYCPVRQGAADIGNAIAVIFELNRLERNIRRCQLQHLRPFKVDLVSLCILFSKEWKLAQVELLLWLLSDPLAEQGKLSEPFELLLDFLLNFLLYLHSPLSLLLETCSPGLAILSQHSGQPILVDLDTVGVLRCRLREKAVLPLARSCVFFDQRICLSQNLHGLVDFIFDRALQAVELGDLVLCPLDLVLLGARGLRLLLCGNPLACCGDRRD